jgi:hypothetical protein
MKKLSFIIFILLIVLALLRCKSHSDKSDYTKLEENTQIHLFSPQKLLLNDKILNFVKEFIKYTDKEFGNDNKYALYFENLIGDRHLISIYLLPKNEKIEIDKFVGYMTYEKKIIFLSLCLHSVLDGYYKEIFGWNDKTYVYWQLEFNRNEATVYKTITKQNDTIHREFPIQTTMRLMIPTLLEMKTSSKKEN